MYNQKLCLGLSGDFSLPYDKQIKLFAETGFDAFFTGWKSGDSVKQAAAIAKETGMIYQSVHAPFNKTDDMWHGSKELVDIAVNELKECIHDCAENGVPIMVSHVFIGFDCDYIPNEQGINNFGIIIDEAEKCGVKIAFENTEGEEYLDAIFKEFGKRNCVGFCLDTGHEMCYNRSRNLLADYGSKLIATHINDNLGIRDYGGKTTFLDDLHLLPFDGIRDWDETAKRFDECGYNGIMTFELNRSSKPGRHENDIYGRMTIEEYIAEVYKRACRFAAKRKIKSI